MHYTQLQHHHQSVRYSDIKVKVCYFESHLAFSWPAAVNHSKHMFTWLFLPTHFQLSAAPTENNNKHLVHPQRGNWKHVRCTESSGSSENINHTSLSNFLSYISYFDQTTTYSVDYQVQLLLWIITKDSEKAQGKKSARVSLTYRVPRTYSMKAPNSAVEDNAA